MFPVSYEMVKFKIDEELRDAARQRQAREAAADRPRSIDFSAIGQRLRVRLFGGTIPGRPAAPAGA